MHRRAAAIAGLAMILTGCGEPPQPAAITTTVKVTKTVTMTVPSPPAPPKTVMEMDGMYRVGIDIEPVALKEVNAAMERLARGDVKGRFVIDFALAG